jgi:hypothetical protein
MIDFFEDRSGIFVLQEATNENLYELIIAKRKQMDCLPDKLVFTTVVSILKGLLFLHMRDQPIAFRDLNVRMRQLINLAK